MSPEQFAALERGDIVRNGRQARSWLVAANNGDHVALVDYRHASNPGEWELVLKAAHVRPGELDHDQCPEVLSGWAGNPPRRCELDHGHDLPHRHDGTSWAPVEPTP